MTPLLDTLRQELAAVADPARTPQMQAYMKSAMPFHGVPAPAVKAIARRVFDPLKWEGADAWREAVRAIWHGAEFREERYLALALAGHKSAKRFQTPDALPLYEELIVSGAWWDFVDDLAIHRVGPLVQRFPDEVKPIMRAWSRCEDMWQRRSAIICQVGLKADTDMALLYACIEPALDSKEFFLRKAIGWALRQVAWRDPLAVLDYVSSHEDRLSPLSRREALKNLGSIDRGLV